MTTKYGLYSMGNALLDYEIEVLAEFLAENNIQKGTMTLVDELRQDFLLKKVEGYQHKRTCGGSAANTTIAFSQLGATSFYSCKVGGDSAGEFYLKSLNENGVESDQNITSNCEEVTGKCLVFVTPDADRTMNTFLGISANYGLSELNEEALSSSSHLYIEGYLTTNPQACKAVEKSMALAFSKNIPISMTFSDPFIVNSFKQQFINWLQKPIDLIFCNEEEAYSFTGSQKNENIEEVGRKLLKYTKKFAITRGAKGAYLYNGDQIIIINTTQVDAINTNGAGDLFAGAFLWALENKLCFSDAGRLATTLSSKLVTKFGARLKRDEVLLIKEQVLG